MQKYILIFILFFISTAAFAKNKSFQVAGFIGTSLSNQSTVPAVVTIGASSYISSFKSTYENSPSGGLEMRSIDSNSWLFKGGLKTMAYRKVTAATIEIPGFGTQSVTMLTPYSYKLTSIYTTTGYCWESFYLMVGLSYNLFDFSSPGSTTPYRTKNGAGGIFGMGYKLTENWSVEYTGYSALVSVESGANYQTKDDFTFSDAVLSVNYGF